jgi:hypothetical protein
MIRGFCYSLDAASSRKSASPTNIDNLLPYHRLIEWAVLSSSGA